MENFINPDQITNRMLVVIVEQDTGIEHLVFVIKKRELKKIYGSYRNYLKGTKKSRFSHIPEYELYPEPPFWFHGYHAEWIMGNPEILARRSGYFTPVGIFMQKDKEFKIKLPTEEQKNNFNSFLKSSLPSLKKRLKNELEGKIQKIEEIINSL